MPWAAERTRAFPAGTAPVPWFAADGWPVRMLRVEPVADPHGAILLMGGRGDFIEKYLETIHDLVDAGFVVGAMDWRGQGGSGRLSHNPHVGHVADFAIWVDDLAHFWARWQSETPGPHFAIGHSMGGHLLLRALAEGRIAPQAAVLVAPMLGYRGGIPMALGTQIARMMCAIGDPARAAWKVSEKPGSPAHRRMNLLTHDAQRYADEGWWHVHNPELRLGPASWGWVHAGYRSMRALAVPDVLSRVAAPLSMLVAEADGLVDPAMALRAARHLPNVAVHRFGREAAHELLREADPVRNRAMQLILDFLRRHGA